ncbi:hypothetical protein [Marinibactrum halimedae]|uniref:hypothetical protein n=1 Tax=Marinibactrum halimedae TaxID=1444977 RepID=UPI001E34ED2E|nr:hypothetical protein [Marinibactrum halimedae]MCD9458214.1 hypothetical protein [Marinibactrum halimedae]
MFKTPFLRAVNEVGAIKLVWIKRLPLLCDERKKAAIELMKSMANNASECIGIFREV